MSPARGPRPRVSTTTSVWRAARSPSRRLSRVTALVVTTLAALAVLSSPTLAAPASAAAVAGGSVAGVPVPAATAATPTLTLTAFSPPVAVGSVAVTVTGTITAGTSPVPTPTVALVRSATRLTTRDSVTAWATGTASSSGTTWGTTTSRTTIAAGATVPFTLTVPAGTVTDRSAWGALALSLQLSSAGTVLTTRHTFLGWQERKEYEPLSIAVVAPITLSDDPDLQAMDDTARLAAWEKELGTGSRLDRIVRATDQAGVPVTWAVDPAVLGPDRTTSSGSSSGTSTGTSTSTSGTSGTGSPTPGGTSSSTSTGTSTGTPTGTPTGTATTGTGGDTEADPVTPLTTAFAARLAAAASRHALWALPYADPDVAATVDAAPTDPTVRSEITRAAGLADRLRAAGATAAQLSAVSTGVAWPADGGLPAARATGLRTAYGTGLRGALVSGSVLPSTSGFSATAPHLSPSELPLLGWDDTLSALTLRTSSVGDGVLATQELVAQTATLLGQSPGVSRQFLVAIPRSVDPADGALSSMLGALRSIPWVALTTADALVDAAGQSSAPLTSVASSTVTVPAPAVTAPLLRRITAIRPSLDTVVRLFPGRAQERDRWEDTLDQLTSVRWRDRPGVVTELADRAGRWSSEVTSGIRVVAQDTNFLADEGILQVTVINDLDDPVEGLVVRLSPANPRLRVVAQPDPVSIAGKSRAKVNVRVRAVAAGLVPVNVTLAASDGMSVGTPAELGIRANPPGRGFYLVSGLVVALVLVVGVARSLRGRRRARAAP